MKVRLPPVLATDHHLHGQWLRRLAAPARWSEGQAARFARGNVRGTLFIPDAADEPDVLVVSKVPASYAGRTHVVKADVHDTDMDALDLSAGTWLAHPAMNGEALSIEDVRRSWDDALRLRLEDPATGRVGLRPPQLGAVHAVLAHWTLSRALATVVMPTGTGKTDTMATILVAARCGRTLVVVPSAPLRTQLADKFLGLGVLTLPGAGLLDPGARCPTVAVLKEIPKTIDDLDAVFEKAHVIVTTSHIATRCTPALQARLAHWCPHLFIDEAHHAQAATWSALRTVFADRRVLQLTATPFREDGQLLEGEIVFRYRLRQAFEDGYFQPIRFVPLSEFVPERADRAIADRAVAELRATLDRGHVLMARASTIDRAEAVYELYREHGDLNPVRIHTRLGVVARREARRQILDGTARIIVCVDMLGEGFDLPQLKIAAFHDVRKSLPVTLQLIGRFTRTGPGFGEAVAIANTADIEVRDELDRLYRDGDWNVLLPEIADNIVDDRMALQDFVGGFGGFEGDVSLHNVHPTSSAVVYRTTCANWMPENFRDGLSRIDRRERLHHAINPARHTLVVISASREAAPWSDDAEIVDWTWELMIAVWSPAQKLLFIHASALGGSYKNFAHAVAGTTAQLVRDQDVFRVFSGIARLQLQNVGLKEQLGRNVRYTGRMGSDAEPAISDLARGKASKAVLGGVGFEGGAKITIGASVKGRIWSMRRPTLDQFVLWCEHIGEKLIDTSIDPDAVLSGTLKTAYIGSRPDKVPIAVGWPEEVYAQTEHGWALTVGDRLVGFHEIELRPAAYEAQGPLEIEVSWDTGSARLELVLSGAGGQADFEFEQVDGPTLAMGRRAGRRSASLTSYLSQVPATIWFADGSSLEGNRYTELRDAGPPFPADRIEAWEWLANGVDIKKESYIKRNKDTGRLERRTDSIQYHVIRTLITEGGYRVIVDDDDHGEAADVVAVRVVEAERGPSTVEVDFYHCKYTSSEQAGARLDDLYVVCGQTQKSVVWAASPDKKRELFAHLLRRNALRTASNGESRMMLGDAAALEELRAMARALPVTVRMILVQPGVSRAVASRAQRELLASTETYLRETYQLSFRVIGSE